MRRWTGGKKSFNGLEGISADLLQRSLALYSLSRWEREFIGAIGDFSCVPMRYAMRWSVDAVLKAGEEIHDIGWR